MTTTDIAEENDDFSADSFTKYRQQKIEEEKKVREESGVVEEEDEEVQIVWGQVRKVQQESLQSTRNTLAKLRETQDVGANTLDMLYKQGDQLAKVERNIEQAKVNADEAEHQADELEKYNGMIPVNFGNVFSRKKKKRDAEYAAAKSSATKGGPRGSRRTVNLQKSSNLSPAALAVQGGEPIEDEAEAEIDENLNEISAALDNLKDIGLAMNKELDVHNETIKSISTTADDVSQTIKDSEKKIKKFL